MVHVFYFSLLLKFLKVGMSQKFFLKKFSILFIVFVTSADSIIFPLLTLVYKWSNLELV